MNIQVTKTIDRKTGQEKVKAACPNMLSYRTMATEAQLDEAIYLAIIRYVLEHKESPLAAFLKERSYLNREIIEYLPAWQTKVHYDKRDQHSGWAYVWTKHEGLRNLLRGLREDGAAADQKPPMLVKHEDLKLTCQQIKAEIAARHIRKCWYLLAGDSWLYPAADEIKSVYFAQLRADICYELMESLADTIAVHYENYCDGEVEVDFEWSEMNKCWDVQMTFPGKYFGIFALTMTPKNTYTHNGQTYDMIWS